MTVCYWGTYDRDYPRNRILMAGLREAGVEVRECHSPLWKGTADKLRHAASSWLSPLLLARWAWAYLSLSARFLASPRPDFLFVGYSGHFDVFPAWCLSRLRGVPLVFDAFLSLYDSLVLDRGRVAASSWRARLLAWLDRASCRLSDRVLLDTGAHRDFFCETFGLEPGKFWVLPIGADDTIFDPGPGKEEEPPPGRALTLLHYGRYIPLHGLDSVIRAAHLLEERGEACRFLLVGEGEERPRTESLSRELGVRSVEFRDSVPPGSLAEMIRCADVCLGIFGKTGKAGRVVPNKVYEAMAMGKPVITGDSPAAREILTDGEDCILCERGSGEDLARAILRLQRDRDLAGRLGRNARRRFEEVAAPAVLGRTLVRELESWRGSGARGA
jgi:glycosyltransferase involved in cell wall biosynthesis